MRNVLFWHFFLLFIVYIVAKLMKPCLSSRARNLVLFGFYFSTAAIAEDFSYSQCKIQVTAGLILTKKIWSCFEKILKLINWITFDAWFDKYKKVPLKTNSLKQYKVFINSCTINLGIICVRYFVTSSEAPEDYKKEWSVYKIP